MTKPPKPPPLTAADLQRMGGNAVKEKYGREHFVAMAKQGHKNRGHKITDPVKEGK